MLTDGRKLFRMLREMAEGEVSPHLLEAIMLATLEDSCETCHRILVKQRETARKNRLLQPLLDAWYEPARQPWALERAQKLRRELLRIRFWDVRFDRVENARTELGLPALVALLLVDAGEQLQQAPQEAERFARLAEMAACRGPAAVTPGCRLLAAAHVANTLRAGGQLRAAAAQFAATRDLEPPNSLWIRAEVLSLQASLLKDQRRLPEARTCLKRALRGFEDAGDALAVGRVKLNLGAVEKHSGNLREAIFWTRSALPGLQPHEDGRLHLWAHHNLAAYYCEAGDVATARRLVEHLDPLYRRFRDGRTAIRRQWLGALIMREEGDLQGAEGTLREVMKAFLQEDLRFHSALVALDLALLLLQEGRMLELQQLSESLVAVFEDQQVYPEAQAAALLLRRAVASERVTRRFLLRLRSYFEQARANPDLRFPALGEDEG